MMLMILNEQSACCHRTSKNVGAQCHPAGMRGLCKIVTFVSVYTYISVHHLYMCNPYKFTVGSIQISPDRHALMRLLLQDQCSIAHAIMNASAGHRLY
eukprot:SAG31_NODE_5069_length_2761_cov_11.750699_2_plen_98_part_00